MTSALSNVGSCRAGGARVVDRQPEVILVNPLGAALKHYTASLERMLVDCGATVTSVALMEPSASGQSRRRWIGEYFKTLWKETMRQSHGASHAIVIQTWPLLGYLDYLVAKPILRRTRALIIIHDPTPLVHARGYGRFARWAASRRLIAATAVVHSDAAAEVVSGTTSLRDVIELPHPMLPPEKRGNRGGKQIVVRVLGQYKADRDLESMRQLATQGPSEWRYEVIGRGWPPVAGWTVVDRFVNEDDFDSYLRSSNVIVIPYSRFFQSGVAIRSLEVGTPVVGMRASSLADLVGSESAWLVDGEPWLGAVEAAIRADSQEIYEAASSAYRDALRQWRTWLERSAVQARYYPAPR